MNQIELLLRLSENAQDKGDEIAKRYSQERADHVRELHILMQMIDQARQNVQAELSRFGGEAKLPSAGQFAKDPAPAFLMKAGAGGGNSESRPVRPDGPPRGGAESPHGGTLRTESRG